MLPPAIRALGLGGAYLEPCRALLAVGHTHAVQSIVNHDSYPQQLFIQIVRLIVKQRFSRWYNRGHERFGTLWAERFRSVLVEDGGFALEAVSGYIDLNPVRAGLVQDPKDYRFCGYASALAGNTLARKGLMSFGEARTWGDRAAEYRMRLFVGAGTAHQIGKRALSPERIEAELARRGQLSAAEALRFRLRHFRDGLALGSRGFVEEVFTEFRERFGPKRRSGSRPVRALAAVGLVALRDLRLRVLE